MKRHFNLLASVLLVIAMVFAFASCDVIGQYIPGINQPEPEHQHTFVDGSCECGEADPDYVAPHEHNFVEGKCECGETDPNYVEPVEPVEPQEELNFFQKILAWFMELIQKLLAIFKR